MIFVLAGPSGAGKGTVAAAVVERLPTVTLSRSWTTRPRRRGEPDDAYTFVDEPTFAEAVEAGRFIEWAEVFGHRYGTPRASADTGGHVLLEIDVQGARQVRDVEPDAVVIFLEVPSRVAQEERLRARGDAPEVIAARLAAAPEEEAIGRRLADHLVVNDDLDRAVDEVAGILARSSGDRLARPSRPRTERS